MRFVKGTASAVSQEVRKGWALEQKQNFRNVLEMVRGGFFLGKNPLDRSDSPYTYSAFAIAPEVPAPGNGEMIYETRSRNTSSSIFRKRILYDGGQNHDNRRNSDAGLRP